ncbi:uncharacterized protein BDZ83DRAFT_183646 [Colletotrichum acutatum]|uniref:Secreted protein n=1 Tax=Glomerella acutata TaxID=27357 RepID=A0AAD8X8J5_GLOAC|nr:uncharacterized protein BDZ83DRAFT_183646 [Colletotrichum acutatum]KAK1707149.1 hypothetical protein BDZ83DRAFT_183646 [Colletotrichum acutatum]
MAPLQSRQIHFFFFFFPLLLQGKFQPPAHWAFLPVPILQLSWCCWQAGAASDCCCVRRSWLLVVVARLVLASFVFHTDSCHPIIPRNPLHHRLVSSV